MPMYGTLGKGEETELGYHSPAQPLVLEESQPRQSLVQRFGLAATALLGVAAVVGVSVNARSPDVDLSGRAPPTKLVLSPQLGPGEGKEHSRIAGADDTEVEIDGVTYSVTKVDLTSHPVISEYVAKNLDTAILPDLIQLFWNKNLTDGDIGNQASEGYVVLSMAHGDYLSGDIDACYTVVMALDGTIVQAQVAPTQEVDDVTYYTRFEGLKMKDSTTVLLAQNTDAAGDKFYSWDLSGDALENSSTDNVEPLPIWDATDNATGSSHDIQYVSTEEVGVDGYLVINNNLDKLFLYNPNGTVKWEYTPSYINDVDGEIHFNHAQIAYDKDGELSVFVSVRDMSCIAKLNFTSGAELWKLGGLYSDFNVTDLDGRRYVVGDGHGAFTHQHNAEYIGDGKFALFDNGYNGSLPAVRDSRMVIMHVDEDNLEATITWEWQTGVHALIFGDADPLPTGNVVGTFWPATVHPNSSDIRESFEASAVEVTRTGSTAWMLGVKGTGMSADSAYDRYDQEAPVGWAFYSIERFYTSLLIKGATMDTSSGMVSFSVYNTYRQQFDLYATAVITCGGVTRTHAITIAPHWQETTVSQAFEDMGSSCEVSVSTQTNSASTRITRS